MNILLWIIQILLALLFLFSGVTKLYPLMDMTPPPNSINFPIWFLKFIAVCEVLGALGLILPGLLRRNQYLTPLAAIGLLIIMIGAVIATIMGPGLKFIVIPVITGLLCAFVAYGRRGYNR
jgi:uncharacterized membrane protein YphA (DoxX/SURF4 family)